MSASTPFYVFAGIGVVALVFILIGITVIRRYAEPGEPELSEAKISFLQLLLLGIGGIFGVGSLIAAFITITSAQRLEEQRAENEQKLEVQSAEATLLQEYLQHMETLVIDNKLPEFDSKTDDSEKDRIRRTAGAQSSAVLRSVEDPERKRVVIRFLDDTGLIKKPEPVVDLWGANLVGADLAYLGLGDANLGHALLTDATLTDSSLTGTYLYGAHLDRAHLSGANLTGANLGWTGLARTDLHEADLTNVDLRDATGITNEELEGQAKSLHGATMPDGSMHD